MSNYKLTQAQQDELETMQGASAVIMGYLKAERGRIAPSIFNKLIQELQYPKQNKQNLIDIAEEVNESEVLKSLYIMGYERDLKLDDIPNFVAEGGKLKEEDTFSQITSFIVDNETTNARLREMRHLQRQGAYTQILMKDLKKSLTEELMGMPRAKYLQTPIPEPAKGDKSLILCFADWHIGFMSFNMRTGDYNFKKLNVSINNIVAYTLQVIRELDIKHLYVVNVGDTVEQVSMRNVSQAFEAEMPMAEQIAKGTRLTTEILAELSKHIHVTFGIVAGNHDRLQSSKTDVIPNDSVAYVILDSLFMLQEDFGQLPNVTLIDNRIDVYEFTITVAGKKVKVVHGDHEAKNAVKIPKHEKEGLIDYLITGHYHSSSSTQENYHKFHLQVGSTVGENSYSKQINAPITSPSQLIVVITEGNNSPMLIPLMLNKEGGLEA